MTYRPSYPMTNEIVGKDTLLPLSERLYFAGVDRLSNDPHYAQIVCFGRTQEEANNMAATISRLLNEDNTETLQ